MKSNWTEQRERSNKTMLSLLTWMALHLGRRFIQILMYPITAYFFLFARDSRNASRNYLSRVFGRPPSNAEMFRHFYVFAMVSVDRLFFLSGRYNKYNISLHGQELFNKYIDQGQGCILMVSHLGSFDVMRVPATKDYSLPIRILMDRNHNPGVVSLLESLDPELAKGILDAGQAAPELALTLESCLKNGDLIGVMGDRARPDERVQLCEFLNSPAAFPVSPWLLSLVLKVPVILCFGLYKGGNHYSLHFELLSEQLTATRKTREQEINRVMAHYSSRLEYYVKQAPYNWFNFYDFWHNESTTDN